MTLELMETLIIVMFSAFMLSIFGSLISMAIMYRICLYMGLKPGEPLGTFSQLRFYKYVRSLAREPRGKYLRLWIRVQNTCMIVSMMMLAILALYGGYEVLYGW